MYVCMSTHVNIQRHRQCWHNNFQFSVRVILVRYLLISLRTHYDRQEDTGQEHSYDLAGMQLVQQVKVKSQNCSILWMCAFCMAAGIAICYSYLYASICIHIYTCLLENKCVHVNLYMYIHIFKYEYISVHLHVYLYIWYVSVCTYTYIYIYICTYKCFFMYLCIYVCTYIYLYITSHESMHISIYIYKLKLNIWWDPAHAHAHKHTRTDPPTHKYCYTLHHIATDCNNVTKPCSVLHHIHTHTPLSCRCSNWTYTHIFIVVHIRTFIRVCQIFTFIYV